MRCFRSSFELDYGLLDLRQILASKPQSRAYSRYFLVSFGRGAALAPGKRSASSPLVVEYISEEFPDVQIDAVGRRRRYWNDAAGKLSWPISLNIL